MRLNKPVYLNTLRGFLDAPLRLVLLALVLLVFYGLAGAQGDPLQGSLGLSPDGQAKLLAVMASLGNKVLTAMVWLLGYGLVSREANRGSIQLVLLRPLSRASYVLSKWAALVSLAWGATLAVHLIFLARGWMPLLGPAQWGLMLAAQLLQVAALAAVLTLLSCVPVGFGELGLLVLGWLGLLLLGGYAQRLGWAWLGLATGLGRRFLLPDIQGSGLMATFAGAARVDVVGSLPFNAAVLLLALAGAIALLGRREFSYADQG